MSIAGSGAVWPAKRLSTGQTARELVAKRLENWPVAAERAYSFQKGVFLVEISCGAYLFTTDPFQRISFSNKSGH